MSVKTGSEGGETGEDNTFIDDAMATLSADLFGESDDGDLEGDAAMGGGADDAGGAGDAGGSAAAPTKKAPPGEGETAETAADTGVAADTPPSDKTASDTPPQSWTAEAKAHWATVPPLIQKEILKREGDFFKGIEQYKDDASAGKFIKDTLQPYLPVMRQHNVDPGQRIQELLQLNYEIAIGTPERRAQIFGTMMKTWGVDPSALIQEQAYEDPAVAGLRKDLAGVSSTLSNIRAAEEARVRDAQQAEVNTFLADPVNVYVQEVVGDMIALLNARACKSLKEAYEKAVWANPVTRAKEQARLDTETRAKRDKDEADRVAKARLATGANVRSNGQQGKRPETVGSIDETIEKTLATIKARG